MSPSGRERYRAKGGWPVNVNLRIRRIGGKQPTDAQAIKVLHSIATTGRVPRGWEATAVQWEGFRRRPGGFVSTGWHRGQVPDDVQALAGPILAGAYQVGWERRQPAEGSWERYRLKAGESSGKYRPGEWVSAAYAKRYPDKVVGVQARGEEDVTDYDIDWWEAEVRVDYEGE